MRNKSTRLESEAGNGFKLLTLTGKMPGYSFSLKAWDTCPGAKMGEALYRDGSLLSDTATVCGSCYARKGNYRFPSVVNVQDARTRWTRDRVADGTFASLMIPEILSATLTSAVPYFRIHDAGDFFSPRYVDAWIEVCRALPNVQFWAPTRSFLIPSILARLAVLASLPNVTIRPSALTVDSPAPVVAGLHAGSEVSTDGGTCPARFQGNSCGPCRSCWTDRDTVVSYHAH